MEDGSTPPPAATAASEDVTGHPLEDAGGNVTDDVAAGSASAGGADTVVSADPLSVTADAGGALSSVVDPLIKASADSHDSVDRPSQPISSTVEDPLSQGALAFQDPLTQAVLSDSDPLSSSIHAASKVSVDPLNSGLREGNAVPAENKSETTEAGSVPNRAPATGTVQRDATAPSHRPGGRSVGGGPLASPMQVTAMLV